jgi:hypothetical protein
LQDYKSGDVKTLRNLAVQCNHIFTYFMAINAKAQHMDFCSKGESSHFPEIAVSFKLSSLC